MKLEIGEYYLVTETYRLTSSEKQIIVIAKLVAIKDDEYHFNFIAKYSSYEHNINKQFYMHEHEINGDRFKVNPINKDRVMVATL